MSKTKSSLLDERMSQFFDSTAELLTDIHARNESESKGTSKKKRGKRKPIALPNPNIDALDEEPSGI
jgi:hypothetical protein